MIYVTGDVHGSIERFAMWSFPQQLEMTKNDFVIILGDFGMIWDDNSEERFCLSWLNDAKFTTLFVDGNHENFDRLNNDYEIVDFHGGKAHKIRENIYHLIRGNVYELEGKKFWAFGGARSTDIDDGILDPDEYKNEDDFILTYRIWDSEGKMFRVKGRSWWPEEMATQEEMDFGNASLDAVDRKVDFIITHCAPSSIEAIISGGTFETDAMTKYFQKISETTQFEHWYCGHYHLKNETVLNKYTILYEDFVRIV